MQMLTCRPERVVVEFGADEPLDLYNGYVETVFAERGGDDEPFAWIIAQAAFPKGRYGDDDAPLATVVVDNEELPGSSVWYIWPETSLTAFVVAGWLARRMQELQDKYPEARVASTVLFLDGTIDVDEFLAEPQLADGEAD